MDAKLRQITRLLKRYDSDLFPKRFLDGSLGIMRKKRAFDFYRLPEQNCVLWFAHDWDDLVVPVTENWIETGRPVDWGIEPILAQIQKTDSWRDDGDYERFVQDRERKRANDARAFKNEIRARTADLRRDFARATQDINTSNLEKTEKRRMYDGYRR